MAMRPLLVKLPLAFGLVLCLLLLPYIYRGGYRPAGPRPKVDDLISQQPASCDYTPSAFPIPNHRNVREYARGIVKPRYASQSDPDLSEIDGTFLDTLQMEDQQPVVNEGSLRRIDTCAQTDIANLTFAHDPPVEVTEPILIGVASKVARLERAFKPLLSQFGGTRASLVALVENRDDLKEVQGSMRSRGLDITLYPTDLPYLNAYFSLVETFHFHIQKYRPQTRWVIWSDDDTYIPSMRSLGQRLATLDHTQDHFYGTLSEKTHHLKAFGRLPYGGGGIIFSVPVVSALHEHYDYCTGRDVLPADRTGFGGDRHVWTCLKKAKPDLNMTVWPELRQMDIHGSPAGLYEDGRPIWSYHHWTNGSWAPTPVVEMAMTRSLAGESSLRHRYIFDKKLVDAASASAVREYFVLTSGYSVVRYQLQPDAPDIDFNEREATWWEAVDSTEFDDYIEQLGPLRNATVAGIEKKRWVLEDAKEVQGNLHQLYVCKKHEKKTKKGKGNSPESEKKAPLPEAWIEIIWLRHN